MRFKNCFFLILFLLAILYSDDNIKNENNETFIDAVNKNRKYIISKINDPLLKYSDYQKGIFLEDIKESLTNDISLKKRRSILQTIYYLGRELSSKNELNLNYNTTFKSDFIEDEKLYHLCVLAFKDKNLRYDIYNPLVNNSREDYLKKYSMEIKECIKKNWEATKQDKKDFPYLELYMLLPLSKKEKSELFEKINSKNIPIHYLVRLGDKKAEKQLISQFEKAKHYKQYRDELEGKASLANKLGIAGTPGCAKALIRELNSPIAEERNDGNYRSVRIPIIKALGRMHPELPFLRMDIKYIEDKGDYYYCLYHGKDINKIRKYLDKVIDWAEKTYNVKPAGKSPETPLSKRSY